MPHSHSDYYQIELFCHILRWRLDCIFAVGFVAVAGGLDWKAGLWREKEHNTYLCSLRREDELSRHDYSLEFVTQPVCE